MYSTYPHIAQYTRSILKAAAKKANMTPEGYRLGVLKRVECEISVLLENKENDLIAETRDVLGDLLHHVRIAIAED